MRFDYVELCCASVLSGTALLVFFSSISFLAPPLIPHAASSLMSGPPYFMYSRKPGGLLKKFEVYQVQGGKIFNPQYTKVFEELKILQLPVLKFIQERSYRALWTATN